MSAGSTQSGMRPTWRSSSRRRGDAEASTRGGPVTQSPPQVEHANQGEQAPGRVEIDLDLVGEPLDQQRGPFIVQGPPADVDRLDLREARPADRFVIAVADHEIIFDDTAKRRQRQSDRFVRAVRHRADFNAQPVLLDRQMQMVGPAAPGNRCEMVLFEEVEDRHGTLVLDVGAASDDGMLVESDAGDTRGVLLAHSLSSYPARARSSRIDNDNACASSPSASASRIADGASAARLAASQRTIELRLRKSRTPRPDAKRALRAVGRTWLGPAM